MDPFAALSLDPVAFAFAAVMAGAAGLIRGFSGFGATMTLAPALSLVMPPPEAVAVALMMETARRRLPFPSAPGGLGDPSHVRVIGSELMLRVAASP